MRSLTVRLLLFLSILIVTTGAFAHDVTITGTQTFASLDGSSSDHDGATNGAFTVSDGNLIVNGVVNCNDDTTTSACSMAFVVSGSITINAGGALHAENRSGGGNGGAIALTAGGNVAVNNGGLVSSSSRSSSGSAGGNISASAGGSISVANGGTIDAGSSNAQAGKITLTASGLVSVDGNVLSGPSRTILATRVNGGAALDGGTSNQVGGEITISSTAFVQPAVVVGSNASIVSQGETSGAGPVTITGCGIEVRGLVAALSKKDAPARVSIRSGQGLLIDGRDLGVAGATLGRTARVRADAPTGTAVNKGVDLFAAEGVQILGPAAASSTLYVITSMPGLHDAKSYGGLIRVLSTGGAVTASGNIADSGRTNSGDTGGTIEIAASDDVNLATAVIRAVGDFSTNNPNRGGGSISVRSYSGDVIWINGLGEVRPIGSNSGLTTADQGSITLTACGSVTTTGTSFPVMGTPTFVFPNIQSGVCSPGAPSLPAGVPPFVTCNNPPVADDAAASTNEEQSVTITLSGSDVDGDPLTFSIVSGPSNGSLGTIVPVNSTSATVVYTPNADYNGGDSFVYQANDGNGGTDTATVTITIAPVNDAPSFQAGADVTSLEDAGPQTFAPWATSISAGPADESAQTVTFSVTGNSNPSLFAVAPSVSSTGVLTYTAAADAYGSATVTIVAQDNGGTANGGADTSASQSFIINVQNVNDAPSFTGGGDQTVGEDAGAQSVANWATAISAGPNEGSQSVAFTVTGNSNASLFAVAPSISPSGTLTYTPAANANGNATITVVLADDGGTANGGVNTSAASNFVIEVNAVNDAPRFTSGGDVTVLEDSAAYSAAWATGISAGPADESTQTVSFSASNDNNGLFSVQPSVAPNGTLSFTVAPDAFGTATVTVSLSDNGGTANGGADTSAAQSFTITVTAVNDAPSFTSGGDVSAFEDSGAYSAAWATGISAGPSETQNLTFLVSNDNNGLFSVQPSISAAGVLSFTPAANANGSALVTVILQDDGGTANGGSDSSASVTFTITIVAVNDEPSFTGSGDVSILEDSGAYSAQWIASVSAGPADENTQTVSYTVANDNNALFTVQPAISPNGVLTFTLASNAFGSATVSAVAHDNGGTANGGDDTTAAQSFVITVNAVNDAPSFTAGGNVTVAEDSGAYSATWATTISAGANETQNLTFVVSNNNNALFSSQPAIAADGTLTFTSAPNAFGAATVTVYLQDDGGTADGGVDTSASVSFTITVTDANDAPVVTGETFDSVGNTTFQLNAVQTVTGPVVYVTGNLLANDSDPDGPSPMQTSVVAASITPGATILMNSNGTFIYYPPAGQTGGDSFQYRVSDGLVSSIATVQLNFHGRVWYTSNTAAPAGLGRANDPFTTLAAAEGASTGGDTVYVFNGNGTTAGQNAGFTLKDSQRLIGEGVALTINASLNGNPAPAVLAPAGSKPRITNLAGSGVTGNLVSNVEVAGLQIISALADGISLNGVTDVAVSTVDIGGSGNNGIGGDDVTNFALANSTITNSGNVTGGVEAGIRFVELLGTSSISNSTISGSYEDNIRLTPASGTLTLTVTNTTIGPNPLATGGAGLNVVSSGTSDVTIQISNSTFTGNQTSGVQTSSTGTGRQSVTAADSQFRDNGVGFDVASAIDSDLTFSVTGSTFLRNRFDAIRAGSASATTNMQIRGTVSGNTIGDGTANSGSIEGQGIDIDVRGSADAIVNIENNNIRNTDFEGIRAQARLGSPQFDLKVRNNTVGTPDDNSAFPLGLVYGILLESRNTTAACFDVTGNTAAGIGAEGIRLRQRDMAILRLAGLDDGDATPNEVINNAGLIESYISSQNNGTSSDAAFVTGFTEAVAGGCRP
ncbi:MAG TPA: Ig-like domain-containing protein [Thermoanaerobaculia bacterium]|jgi:hypothetical protein